MPTAPPIIKPGVPSHPPKTNPPPGKPGKPPPANPKRT